MITYQLFFYYEVFRFINLDDLNEAIFHVPLFDISNEFLILADVTKTFPSLADFPQLFATDTYLTSNT